MDEKTARRAIVKCTSFAASTVTMLAWPALACDDHQGKCQIDGWRSYDRGSHLTIEGSVSFDSGFITNRLFDGDNYLANAESVIEGHAFTAHALNIQQPDDLTLKCSVDPDWRA